MKRQEPELNPPFLDLLYPIRERYSTNISAVVQFNLQNNIAIVSINLSPSIRDKGFAVPCLNAAINYFISKFSFFSIIEADIKSVNLANIKAFEAVGFVLYRQNKEINITN